MILHLSSHSPTHVRSSKHAVVSTWLEPNILHELTTLGGNLSEPPIEHRCLNFDGESCATIVMLDGFDVELSTGEGEACVANGCAARRDVDCCVLEDFVVDLVAELFCSELAP